LAGENIRVLKERNEFREPSSTDGWWFMGTDEKLTNLWQTGKMQSELAKDLDLELFKCFDSLADARKRLIHDI